MWVDVPTVTPGALSPRPGKPAVCLRLSTVVGMLCVYVAVTSASVNVDPSHVRAKAPWTCPFGSRVVPSAKNIRDATPAAIPVHLREGTPADSGIIRDEPLSVRTHLNHSSEIRLTISWNPVPTEGNGYMVSLLSRVRSKVHVRCSCFEVSDNTTSITVSTVPAGSRSRLQRWLNNCLAPSRYDVETAKQVMVFSMGHLRQVAKKKFTLPSCTEMDCRPSWCKKSCKTKHVTDFLAIALNTTAVHLEWKYEPHKHIQQPPIDGFTLVYREIGAGITSTKSRSFLGGAREAIIGDLKPLKKYVFTMTTMSEDRASIPQSVTATMSSKEEVGKNAVA